MIKTFKTNKSYFRFIKKNKGKIIINSLTFTKVGYIKINYDII